MGANTIDHEIARRRPAAPGIVSHGLISSVARCEAKLDGGWNLGTEVISKAAAEEAEYKRQKLAKVLGGSSLPTDCKVMWDPSVSYAGEGPEPRFEGPAYAGRIVYEQDNSRPESERMVPSIEWYKTVPMPERPA